jgi:orotate phosphoribosyltransferase
VNANPVPSSHDIARMLLDAEAVRFGKFTLASGQESNVYIDVKRAWPDPKRLSMMTAALAARVADAQRLAGMELGAVPLVVGTALATGLPYVILRKTVKEHGTRQAYEGPITPGDRCLLIEDVSTTGGSMVRSIEILRGAMAEVDRALVILDRESGATEALAKLGVRLESLVTMRELEGASR